MSNESHTGLFLANEIEEIIKKIGPEKFSAIVTDAGANIQNARKIITEKYQNILNIRCIAHAINLISKDICNTSFANRILTRCNTIVTFFKKSHQGGKVSINIPLLYYIINSFFYIKLLIGSALNKEAKNFQVNGGSLKRWVNTRWHTMFDCVDSIRRHKEVLEKVNIKLLFVYHYIISIKLFIYLFIFIYSYDLIIQILFRQQF